MKPGLQFANRREGLRITSRCNPVEKGTVLILFPFFAGMERTALLVWLLRFGGMPDLGYNSCYRCAVLRPGKCFDMILNYSITGLDFYP
jgi:hypothetical protein